MFELDKYEKKRHGAPARPDGPYTPFEGGRRRAFLLWSEHCIECAAPDCYATCDLYQARPDQRCRRFKYGIYKNRAFASAAGYGAEITFKRWGKLEARGNAALLPERRTRALERAVQLLAPATNGLGRLASRATRDIRWAYITFALLERLNAFLHKRNSLRHMPDAFVIEIYNPTSATVALQLSMIVDRSKIGRTLRPDQLPAPVLRKLQVKPGYFREDLPREAFRDLIASRLPFGIALTPSGPSPRDDDGARLVFMTLDFVQYQAAEPSATAAMAKPRAAAPAVKCVVFDLDNTLWDGVLLEGPVRLRVDVLEVMRRLDERGILISVASKNAHDEAMTQLREFGIEDYLLFPAIDWSPKSEGLRSIAKNLNIGIDALMFIDDSPFERDEVAGALPEVEVLPDSALATLPDPPRLQGAVTAESRLRRTLYRQAMARQSAAEAFGPNYLDFLRACAITVEIRPDRPEDLERICELAQRTNQLNFSGRKYSREEMTAILADPTRERYVIRCADRYGDYGIVGFCLARIIEDGVRIEDLMLSCRVQGKFIEQALLHHLTRRPGWQARHLEINFRRTDRNGAAQAVLAKLGLSPEGDGLLRRAVTPEAFATDLLTLHGGYPSDLPDDRRAAV